MKLSAIWSSPTLTTMARIRRTRDLCAMTIARKLPVRVKYYATLQQIGNKTIDTPNKSVSALVEDIIREFPKSKHVH
jgi:hypothetical protein